MLRMGSRRATAPEDTHARVGSWASRFESRPCLPLPYPHNTSGGRIALLDAERLLLTVGSFGFDHLNPAELGTSDHGKIFVLDRATWRSEPFTTGHGNPEGLLVEAERGGGRPNGWIASWRTPRGSPGDVDGSPMPGEPRGARRPHPIPRRDIRGPTLASSARVVAVRGQRTGPGRAARRQAVGLRIHGGAAVREDRTCRFARGPQALEEVGSITNRGWAKAGPLGGRGRTSRS